MVEARIRAVRAPKRIDTAQQALNAFDRVIQYRNSAFNAYHSYQISPQGGDPARRHHERFQQYDDIASGWETALREYLRHKARRTSA